MQDEWQIMIRGDNIKANNEKLNLSNLSKGVYVIKITTDKNTYTRKVIRN